MKWLDNIVRSGLIDTDEYQKKRGIILTNYISLILCAALLVLFLNRIIFFDSYLIDILFVGLIAFVSPIVLNRFRYTVLSRLILCIVPVCFLWYSFIKLMWEMPAVDQSVYDGIRIFLLSICFIPYLLFDKSRLFILMLGILPTLVSILFFEQILQWADLPYAPLGAVTDDYQLMSARTIIAYTIISISCFVFQSIIGQNDKFNKELLAELKNRAEEIETQNDMLIQSQSRLNGMNQQLEDLVEKKTENIKRQNEILIKYAYTNAHHVRGPVARILGLIQLTKMETGLNYAWFFEKVEQETVEIDKIIKRISDDLNETDVEKI
jgi:signal transduction histidine kinase